MEWAGGFLSSLGAPTIESESNWLDHSIAMLAPVVSRVGGDIVVDKSPTGCEHLTRSFKLCYSFVRYKGGYKVVLVRVFSFHVLVVSIDNLIRLSNRYNFYI